MGFPCGSAGKESTGNAGDLGSIPGLGRSPEGGHGNPLHCSCLENPMDRTAWWATVHGVAKSQTQLSDFTFTMWWSLLKLMSIESVMPSNHLIPCHPLLLLPSIFPSIRVSSNESVLRFRWPKYWSFRFSTSPSSEYSGLISFRMDWLDLLAFQGD